MFKEIVGKNVRAYRLAKPTDDLEGPYRQKKQLSQDDAAALCGFSEKTYSRLERGEANLTVDKLEQVHMGLGISYAEMFDGVE